MAEKRIETVEMRAGDVKTGFGNPRKITKKKKDELRNSIETFGDFGSFIIDENDNIIGGNMRLSVIKEMDPDTIILCKRLIGYSETELRAINIKDNTHSGDWDMDLLADWTADLTVDLGLEKATKKEMEERSMTLAGEWIDVIRFRDWLKNELQIRTFNALKTNRKVPFTDGGIGLIEGVMDSTLKDGQDIGGIAPTEYDDDDNPIYGYSVTVPKASDLTEAERKSRKLTGCKWSARLAGAIHAVEISGNLTF